MKIIGRVKQKLKYWHRRWKAREYNKKEVYYPLNQATCLWWENLIEGFLEIKYPVVVIAINGVVYVYLSIFENHGMTKVVTDILKDYKDYLPITAEGFEVLRGM